MLFCFLKQVVEFFQLCTPLHAAATSGNNLVAEILLEVGADIDARTSFGNSPLHIACLNGQVKVCTELIYCNAPIHAVNFRGQVIDFFFFFYQLVCVFICISCSSMFEK